MVQKRDARESSCAQIAIVRTVLFYFNLGNVNLLLCSDDLIAVIAQYLKENQWLWQIGLASFLIGIFVSLALKYLQRRTVAAKKEKVKPKKEK